MNKQHLSFSSERRFGVELELNSFDGKSRPDQGQKPAGIDYIGMLVRRNSKEGVEVRDWEHTHGNDVWVIKPDSSCGLEVCTPIMKGCKGIERTVRVVKAIGDDPKITADQRCSVHIHAEVGDLTPDEMAKVIIYWIKSEPVFMDSVPESRKCNRYCQPIGRQEIVEHDSNFSFNDLIKRVGNVKYYSLNTNQYVRGNRKTIEFRIGEGDGCKDAFFVKNWVRLILHFMEMARRLPLPGQLPENYDPTKAGPEDQWLSYLWLDPKDVFKVLGFNGDYDLSPGLQQTRDWLLARIKKNISKEPAREYAHKELCEIMSGLGKEITHDCLHPSDMEKALFDDELKA